MLVQGIRHLPLESHDGTITPDTLCDDAAPRD